MKSSEKKRILAMQTSKISKIIWRFFDVEEYHQFAFQNCKLCISNEHSYSYMSTWLRRGI